MSRIRSILGALAATSCAVALSACGGGEDGAIPQPAGEELLAQLDQLEADVEAGDCDAAHEAALEFAREVSALPETVGTELRSALVEAAGNLEELSQAQCELGPTGPTGETELPEVTEPTSTTATTEETTTEQPPPEEEDDGEGGGNEGRGNGPPATPPGQGQGEVPPSDDESSGGIGSDG